MASWADQISQFNPYIQQLPVEAMTQVGMYKQQKYDEGIQKVQSYIDNVAGLDVVRDIDKAYLQSKLNELGSKLKTVAAGDFSNYQLVNSVGGMATQIVKDSNVQTAVVSTSKYRKELERMQKEVNEGKSSPENIKKFNKQAGSWLSSTKVGEDFSASYINYFDVNKFAKETFDSVKPDNYTFDQIFQTDSKGDLVYQDIIDPKTKKVIGKKPILSTYMSRLEQEGHFPETVKDTLKYIFSNPRVSQQLQITGEYNYEGYEGNELKEKVIEIKNKRTAGYDAQLIDLNLKKAQAKDTESLKTIQDEIDKVNGSIEKINSEYADYLKMADENPDSVRGMIYRDDVYDEFTTMYGTLKEKRTILDSPAFTSMFKMQQEENENRKFAQKMDYDWKKLAQDDRHHVDNIRMEIAKLESKLQPLPATPRQVDIKSDMSFNNLEEEIYTNAAKKANTAVHDFIIESGAFGDSINETISKAGGKITPKKAVEKIIDFNAKRLGMTPDQFTNWMYRKANTFMSTSGNDNLTPKQRIAKTTAEDALAAFQQVQTTRDEIEKKAGGPSAMIEATKNLKTLTVRIGNNKVALSPQDQYDIALSYEGGRWFQNAEVKAAAKAAQERLKARGLDESAVSSIIDKVKLSYTDYGAAIAADEQDVIYGIAKLTNIVGNKDNIASLERRSKAIQEHYQISPELQQNILQGTPQEIKNIREQVKGIIGAYVRASGIQESPGFKENAGKMTQIASGEIKGTIDIRAKRNDATGEITQKFVFLDGDGKDAGEVTVTSEEALLVRQNPSSWWQSDEARRVGTLMSRNGTTSMTGKVDDADTYINGDFLYSKSQMAFPNLVNVKDDVKVNISTVNSSSGPQYIAHLFVLGADGKVYKPRQLDPQYSVAQVLQQLKGITPQMIEKFKEEAQSK
jgi:hypothetical protein